MKAFDLQRMALDKVPMEFLGEVALRSLYTFILVFLFLKLTGRRGVRQMSLFEVLIILTLGSAAGALSSCHVADVTQRKAGRSTGRQASGHH